MTYRHLVLSKLHPFLFCGIGRSRRAIPSFPCRAGLALPFTILARAVFHAKRDYEEAKTLPHSPFFKNPLINLGAEIRRSDRFVDQQFLARSRHCDASGLHDVAHVGDF